MKIITVTLGLVLAAGVALPADAQRRDPRDPDDTRAERERSERAAREQLERRPRIEIVTPERFAADRAVIGVVLGEATERGIRVESVAEGGPAARAGIRAGDHLTGIDGVELRLEREDASDPLLRSVPARRLTRALERLEPGDAVSLRVDDGRGTRTERLTTVRADRLDGWEAPETRMLPRVRTLPAPRPAPAPRTERLEPSTPRGERARPARERASLGLSVTATSSERDSLGAFVVSVVQGGPADRAGIHEGARIVSVNGVDLRPGRGERGARARVERLEEALGDVRPGDDVTVRVYMDGEYETVRVRAGRAADVYGDDPRALLGQRFGPGTFEFGPDGTLRVGPEGRAFRFDREAFERRFRAFGDSGARVWRFDGDSIRIERPRDGEIRVYRIGPDGRTELRTLDPERRERMERARAEAQRRRIM